MSAGDDITSPKDCGGAASARHEQWAIQIPAALSRQSDASRQDDRDRQQTNDGDRPARRSAQGGRCSSGPTSRSK